MARARLERGDLVRRLSEVFHARGYAGASLADIGTATGLGKGSLYHAFPGGKEEMAAAVLADLADRFADQVFAPLEGGLPPLAAIEAMFDAVHRHFVTDGHICLFGALSLTSDRTPFRARITAHFRRWHQALVACLVRGGVTRAHADGLAGETLALIEGGIVLYRAFAGSAAFEALLARQRARLMAVLAARDSGTAQRTG
ncbi:MAG: TetR/AcrR family transcriptional regulator [Alphaproteobacteria bacterium]|nr:MAG: TetR/AcrR family transcriptional regulator [Alphaproteobacteria bacterium]